MNICLSLSLPKAIGYESKYNIRLWDQQKHFKRAFMKLDMKIYIQIMIKGLTSAKNFKLVLPLSFNMATVYLSCTVHTVLSRSL